MINDDIKNWSQFNWLLKMHLLETANIMILDVYLSCYGVTHKLMDIE